MGTRWTCHATDRCDLKQQRALRRRHHESTRPQHRGAGASNAASADDSRDGLGAVREDRRAEVAGSCGKYLGHIQ